MFEKDELIWEMDNIRRKMHYLWEQKRRIDREVLEVAEVFDELLNRFNRRRLESETETSSE